MIVSSFFFLITQLFVWGVGQTYHSTSLEVQAVWTLVLSPPCGYQGLNLSCQAWWPPCCSLEVSDADGNKRGCTERLRLRLMH